MDKVAINAWHQWKENYNEWFTCTECKKKIKTFRVYNTGKYCYWCSMWYFKELEE